MSDATWWLALVPALLAVLLPVAWVVAMLVRGRRGTPLIRLAEVTPMAADDLRTLRSFDAERFRVRLSEVYRQVGEAWAEGRQSALDPYVTTDLRASGRTAPLRAPARSVVATFVEAEHTDRWEHVTVRLAGPRGAGPPQFWTLERAAVAVEADCPSCGARLELDEDGRCAHCGAVPDVGRGDWVLSRVEDQEAWEAREAGPRQATLEALDAIRAADPAFDPDTFGERVAAFYPRLRDALDDPSSAVARVVLTPAMLQALKQAKEKGMLALFDGPVSVLGAAIVEARHGEAGDEIAVEVTTTPVRAERHGEIQLTKSVADRLTFGRPPAVGTSQVGSVLLETCPGCGGPLEVGDDGACRHCGAPLTLGTRDWRLTTIARHTNESVIRETSSSWFDDPVSGDWWEERRR